MRVKCVGGSYAEGDFRIVDNEVVADISVAEADHPVVKIAARDLQGDIQRVTGRRPAIKSETADLGEQVILVGTIGLCPAIDALIGSGRLSVADVAGQWETCVIEVMSDPLPGIRRACVIAGSDRRGTAYGVYELCEQIGVSPWYWWADVCPRRQEALIVKAGRYRHGPPSVKYRGIFINDEIWSLREWASRTFAPEDAEQQKGLGPKTYRKVFELLLRLKANLLAPAMHIGTKPFNDYPENKVLADEYAIVMSSSHCEPLLRNNQGEWDSEVYGPWDYATNRDTIRRYWQERIQENGRFENVYTVGMRGLHDSARAGSGSIADRAARLTQIIQDQREILREWVDANATKVPQTLWLYKEVLELFQSGLDLPEDVTLVWPDDNHGYLWRLPTPVQQRRGGGSGVYYHVSYWGRPHDYLWLCSTPPALIWEEMHKAYDHQARTLWILNAGSIKPYEICIEFFLKLGWDIDLWDHTNLQEYLVQWAGREFGEEYRQEVAGILQEYYRLGSARKPEHMGWSQVYPNTQIRVSEFSAFNYGDEAQRRMDEYGTLVNQANTIYAGLPSEKRDAFYQLVVYPLRCASLMSQKFLYAQRNHLYAGQDRASTNDYADKARTAWEDIKAETDAYNRERAGAKWRFMMSWDPRRLPVFGMPPVVRVEPCAPARMGVVVEGGAELPAWKRGEYSDTAASPLLFDVYTQEGRFIDLFSTGSTPLSWTARVSAPWIRLSESSGTLEQEKRLRVEIDWATVPQGEAVHGEICFSGGGSSETVHLSVLNPSSPRPEEVTGFVEIGGCVSMYAEHFTTKIDRGGAGWQVIPGLGRTGKAVTVLPTTVPGCPSIEEMMAMSPELHYRVYIWNPGEFAVSTCCVPTHGIHDECRLRYALAFDDQRPQIVDVETRGNEYDKQWQHNVLQGAAINTTRHHLSTIGYHILRIWMVDPGVVIDKIIMDAGGVKQSYLGPPETRVLDRTARVSGT
jgi:hypothetical protein